MKRYTIKGINDDQSTCDICGKEDLMQVVWLEDNETGKIVAAGTTCAAHLQGITIKEQNQNEKQFYFDQKKKARDELRPFVKAEHKAIDNAPKTYGPNAVSPIERIAYVEALPERIARKKKQRELAEQYGLEVYEVYC